MEALKEHDLIVELPEVPLPAWDAPEPLVLAGEDALVVSYASAASIKRTIVVFHHCYAAHFGLPNDEAFASHPIADGGMRPCGAFEVQRSSWIQKLEARNRAHPRHDPEQFHRLHHGD